MVSRALLFVVASLLVSETALAQRQEGPGYKNVKATIIPLGAKGVEIQEKRLKALSKSVETQDYIVYEYIKCQANWNERCEGNNDIVAPAGWQACKALFSVGQSQNAGYSFTPDGWYTNDLESPDRFRSYHIFLYAYGSGRILDQWGANLDLYNVGLKLIRADATNGDRYAAGCEMPPHD